MDMVSIPPPSRASHCELPVVILMTCTTCELAWQKRQSTCLLAARHYLAAGDEGGGLPSLSDIDQAGEMVRTIIFEAASRILSTLASVMPLMLQRSYKR